MRSVGFLIALLVTGCTRAPPPTPLSDRLLQLADAAAREAGETAPTIKTTDAALAGITRSAQLYLERDTEPTEALRLAVFDESKLVAETNADDLRAMLLPTLLRDQRGTCLGLAQVYLSLAERLDLDLRAVVVPGHLFLRAPGPAPNNIELLRRGIRRSDPFYRSMFQVPEGVAAYMRPLTDDELVGVLHYNLGNAARMRGDLDTALAHSTRAVRLFDDYPEAHATRGLIFQLRGELEAAAAAYARAQQLHPSLDGLGKNVAALEAARRSAGSR